MSENRGVAEVNVLVNGFHCPEQLGIVSSIARAASPGELHHIGVRSLAGEMALRLPGVHALYWEDLFWGGSQESSLVHRGSIDAALLTRMAKWETVTLKMMDRFEFLEDWDYRRRKRCYLDYVKFWHAYLEENRIGLVISQNVPHEVFDFVIYTLARESGIPTLMFYQSQIKDMILPMRDYDGGVIGLEAALERLGRHPDAPVLPPALEAELQSVLAGKKPFYMNRSGVLVRASSFLARVFAFLGRALRDAEKAARVGLAFRLRVGLRKAALAGQSRRLAAEYEKLAEKADLSRPYVYLALHYQPELTTCPLAGPWVDQELIVGLLADCLPEGVELYVKEHPKQTILSRGLGYYSRLTGRRNVHLVSRDTDSFVLTDHALAVATCTGTAGWEALIRGKPVLVFGDIFYATAPGAWRIREREDLVSALDGIMDASRPKPGLDELRRFVQALKDVTIEGFTDPAYRQVSALGFEESNANLSSYISAFIHSLGPGENR